MVRFTNCILCGEKVMTSNTLDGICRICWRKIDNGEEPTITQYIEHDTSLEVFFK